MHTERLVDTHPEFSLNHDDQGMWLLSFISIFILKPNFQSSISKKSKRKFNLYVLCLANDFVNLVKFSIYKVLVI